MRAVLFDMDGVLVHSYEAWYALIEATARDLGLEPVGRERFRQGWGQGPEADAIHWFPGQSPAELERRYDRGLRHHLDQVRVEPDGPRVFEGLRQRGLRVAVVTNTPAGAARDLLDHAGLEPDTLVCASDVPASKPAPDVILEAARRLGVRPAEALVVGDSRYDRQAAARAGAPFAGIGGLEGLYTLERLVQVLEVAEQSRDPHRI